MARNLSTRPAQKAHQKEEILKQDFAYKFHIESYGVKVGFATNSKEILADIKRVVKLNLPGSYNEIEETETDHDFVLVAKRDKIDTLFKNGEEVMNLERNADSIDNIASRIRLTVAEFAGKFVFVHAGVIAWKGKAVIFPGRSFRGKTTLTAALIQRGAVYYSDEYAILDENAFVHPFSKMLSIRGEVDEYRQIDYPVEKFGAVAGTTKIPVGMFLLTEYKENARWRPKILTPANGIIEIIQHTVPIRQNPQFTLMTLQKAVSEALTVKSNRADISKSADEILRFIDGNL